MPLAKNISEPHPGWKLTTCPKCGQECYETPVASEAIEKEGLLAFCTECALYTKG